MMNRKQKKGNSGERLEEDELQKVDDINESVTKNETPKENDYEDDTVYLDDFLNF